MGTSIPVRSNGQIIEQTWFNLPRTEISTLDDRVDALGSNNALIFNVNGNYGLLGVSGSKDQILATEITQSMTLSSAVLKVFTAGSAGSTKIDLQYKRGSGSWTSLLSTAPIVPATAGDYATSATGSGATAAVINASLQSLQPNDLVRLNLHQSQAGNADTFNLIVYHTLDGV